ncbi:accessory Sec system glycosyltransferase GtfB [Staphylococcus simulans]|uniref:accessory Sec system glycosylation chaperone GtfB n=1 Tax=Staphylococcus simulans TaxID=1286 RepID=UPI0030C2BA2A
MINLFENYQFNSKILHESLKSAGYDNYTISLEDDGFLPNDVSSPYKFFSNNPTHYSDKPLFFNEVSVPPFWEIVGNNEMAEIKDMGELRGKIFYQSNFKNRVVKHVEWLDKQQRLRTIDHYNKDGYKYSQTIYDLEGKAIMKKYLDRYGKEIFYINLITQDYVLNWKNKIILFDSKEKFIIYYLRKANIDLSEVIFNSLSSPFIVLYHMNEIGKGLLVWQEKSQGIIPGNMKLMFDSSSNRKYSVIIPDKQEYSTIYNQAEIHEKKRIYSGGYLYKYYKYNQYTRNILTLTNSDQIIKIEELIRNNPDYQFHIAAVTEMSNKLLDINVYENVHLYPIITNEMILKLYNKCDIYLDLNKGSELLDAVKSAFDFNMLVFASNETVHNTLFTAPENILPSQELEKLNLILRKMTKSKIYYQERLNLQSNHANQITEQKFTHIICESLH